MHSRTFEVACAKYLAVIVVDIELVPLISSLAIQSDTRFELCRTGFGLDAA